MFSTCFQYLQYCDRVGQPPAGGTMAYVATQTIVYVSLLSLFSHSYHLINVSSVYWHANFSLPSIALSTKLFLSIKVGMNM